MNALSRFDAAVHADAIGGMRTGTEHDAHSDPARGSHPGSLQDASPPLIMGVLNITPDSFSDGGLYLDAEAALTRARELVAQGAHIIDVGGESTRPGAVRVPPEEEQRRVLPVIEALAGEGIAVSVDTVRASTARLAVAAGASLINDVSGGTADPEMRHVAAESGIRFVIMHWRGIPDPGHSRSSYSDVVVEVRDELARLAEAAVAAGVAAEQVILDPGLGFDKTAEQGWRLLAGMPELATLGYPLLVGASRKRMLGETLQAQQGSEASMTDRDIATAVVSAFAARSGAWGVRVHAVAMTATALAVERAWRAGAASLTQSGTRCRVSGVEATPSATLPDAGQAGECADAGARDRAGSDDRIRLTGLEVFAHHGVFDFERQQGQRFVIDAEVVVDLRAAAAVDELAHTVNYAELADAILVAAEADPIDLIETLAERLANVALGFESVSEARITVHKPNAPIDANFSDVSVTIVRAREVGNAAEVLAADGGVS